VSGNTYYVDPTVGSDERGGTSPDSAWRTFTPINGITLSPGDSIEILSPGSFDQTLSLTGAGTSESPISVQFAPGRYDFDPTDAIKRKYNISNTNDGVDIPKAIAILFDNAKHVHVSGAGAELVLRGKMIEICVDTSEDVTVSGLTFDYQRPTVSEWTVLSATDDSADLEVHSDSLYSVTDGRILWEGEGWSYETGLAQELVPETHLVDRMKNPLAEMRIEELGPFKLRAHGKHKMRPGTVFQLRDTFRDCVGVFMRRSKDVTFRDLNFRFMHGMGILCQFTENITLDKVDIAPDEKSGRTTAAWADCTHFSGCRGKLVIKDCMFCGAHDDAMNVHGTYLRIVEQPGDHELRVRFMHPQTYGFMAFNPGDEVDFVRWNSLAVFGSNRVKAVEMIDPKELLVTLEEPVPSDWHENDVIENVTWTPEVEVSGCTAMRIPSRGFLLSTRRRVVVTDNEFVSLRNGVHCGGEAASWFESGCVRDMVIRGNRFLNGKGPCIHICPNISEPNQDVNRNIRILDNEFVSGTGPAVEATSTTGLVVEGNTVCSGEAVEECDAFAVENCLDVTIEGSRFSICD
jgi:hypothetical protein